MLEVTSKDFVEGLIQYLQTMKNYNCESSYVICLIHFSVAVSCEDKLATDESNEQ